MPLQLQVKPEYEALIPRLTPTEYEALRESIREEGLHYPIVTNTRLVILDGHNRWRACRELGIVLAERDVVRKDFADELLERRFVITSNLRRRQLTDFQKAELAVPLLEIERQLAKARQGRRTDLNPTSASIGAQVGPFRATDTVAREVGLSRPTLERAIAVIERAPEALKAKARSGEISISRAYERTKLYSNLKAGNLRDLVGPELSTELHRLAGGVQEKAVAATLENKLSQTETKRLVDDVLSGSTVDSSINSIVSSRKDLRTDLYRERKSGITRVTCVLPDCRETLLIQHKKGGRHALLRREAS